MCHAVPALVTERLDAETVAVELSGARTEVSTILVGEVAIGEYLLVHVGYALGRIDPEEAQATLDAIAELGAIS